jgi:hypothetical protein
MFCAAARPSFQSFLDGPSTIDWLAVYACVVLRSALSIPSFSLSIAMSGLAAFVVHDALELTWQVLNFSSFTPTRTVAPPVSSFTGALMTTRFAPAVRCALAFLVRGKYAGRFYRDIDTEAAPWQF